MKAVRNRVPTQVVKDLLWLPGIDLDTQGSTYGETGAL